MNGGLSQFMRVMASVDPALVALANQISAPQVPTPETGAGTARQLVPTRELPRHIIQQEIV